MNPSPEQLTAYALGEGTPAEREALAAYLATHAEAAAEVAAISDVAALVSSELSQEAGAPGLDPERRAALAALRPIPPQRPIQEKRLIPTKSLIPPKSLALPIPHHILWPGLLAAGLAVVVMVPTVGPTGSGVRANDGEALSVTLAKPSVQAAPQNETSPTISRQAVSHDGRATPTTVAPVQNEALGGTLFGRPSGHVSPQVAVSAASAREVSKAFLEPAAFAAEGAGVETESVVAADTWSPMPGSAAGPTAASSAVAAAPLMVFTDSEQSSVGTSEAKSSGGALVAIGPGMDKSAFGNRSAGKMSRRDRTGDQQKGGLAEAPEERVAGGEAYPTFAADGWHRVSTAADDGNRWSTLGADVDTASYANVRRFLYSGQLPPSDAVRTEELLNSFHYDYQPPRGRSTPFAVLPEVGPAPWASDHQLVRIALKGYELDPASRPPANLVFLVDVSGSMDQPTKLPLVQRALTLLTQQLRQDDRVAIVTYAGAAGVRLQPTSVENRERIQAAIDGLSAGGGTNGAGGIRIAYDLAKRDFIRGGVNRVVLCTDGDFNVGVSSREELEGLITEQARSNVFLTALGFGMGNYHDTTLQVLADKGNGHYAYIDSEAEARKQIVDGGTGMLVTIAKDVKLQVEFNPGRVGAWRLLGYEKRHLEHQDFSDDKKDGGEIGAGHSMTALYEIIPITRDVGLPTPRYAAEGVARSRAEAPAAAVSGGGELLTVSLRWKLPEGATSTAIAIPVSAHGGEASNDFRFATAVAEFAQSMRGVEGPWSLERALSTAQATAGEDPGRREFIDLIRKAQQLRR